MRRAEIAPFYVPAQIAPFFPTRRLDVVFKSYFLIKFGALKKNLKIVFTQITSLGRQTSPVPSSPTSLIIYEHYFFLTRA